MTGILIELGIVAAVTLAAWIAVRIGIRRLAHKAAQTETAWDDYAVTFARWIGRAVVVVFAIGGTLHAFGLSFEALVGVGGIGGLTLAMASKTAVSQGIGFVLLRTGRYIRPGAEVQIGDVSGKVTHISLSRVVVVEPSGRTALIPCDTVAKSIVRV